MTNILGTLPSLFLGYDAEPGSVFNETTRLVPRFGRSRGIAQLDRVLLAALFAGEGARKAKGDLPAKRPGRRTTAASSATAGTLAEMPHRCGRGDHGRPVIRAAFCFWPNCNIVATCTACTAIASLLRQGGATVLNGQDGGQKEIRCQPGRILIYYHRGCAIPYRSSGAISDC